MTKPLVEFHPKFDSEYSESFRWYGERSPNAAIEFEAEIKSAIDKIQDAPARWKEEADGSRRFLLRRFPYAIVYLHFPEMIYVVALAHYRRKPRYWRDRL
jgi:toxin ParE1/3/4